MFEAKKKLGRLRGLLPTLSPSFCRRALRILLLGLSAVTGVAAADLATIVKLTESFKSLLSLLGGNQIADERPNCIQQ